MLSVCVCVRAVCGRDTVSVCSWTRWRVSVWCGEMKGLWCGWMLLCRARVLWARCVSTQAVLNKGVEYSDSMRFVFCSLAVTRIRGSMRH